MARNDCYIIVAAGTGSRFGAPLPKQFCHLGGRPLLMSTIDSVRSADPQAAIVLVLSRQMIGPWREMCAEASFDISDIIIAAGGASRAESVSNALASVPDRCTGWISVHDGARPVVSAELIERIAQARRPDIHGIIPATAVTDSLREAEADGSSHAVDRSRFRAVQTPQSFPASLLKDAYLRASGQAFTDDASVMEAAGYTNLVLVEGDPRNIKVTHPADIAVAALYLGK